jgi:hypothetical protein
MIVDMFGRKIEKGDLMMHISPKSHPFEVVDVTDTPTIQANPTQMPVASVTLALQYEERLPNPKNSPVIQITDMVVVAKGSEVKKQ